MRKLMLIGAVATATALSTLPSAAQFGGGGGSGGTTGTGDAAAQNLPSTVGIGNQTGNGYYAGPGGGEYLGSNPYYNGRSVRRGPYPPGRPFGPY